MHILAATFFITLLIAGLALLVVMVRRDGRVMLDALLGRPAPRRDASCATGQVVVLRRRPVATARAVSLLPQPEWRAAA